MTNGTSALSLDEKTAGGLVPHPDPAARRGEWSFEQHLRIVEALKAYGCEYLNGREEYTLLKEIVTPDSVTEVTDSGKSRMARKPLNIRAEGSGVISPICVASIRKDTTEKVRYRKPFLAPMDLQKAGSIAQVIPSGSFSPTAYALTLALTRNFRIRGTDPMEIGGSFPFRCRLLSERH